LPGPLDAVPPVLDEALPLALPVPPDPPPDDCANAAVDVMRLAATSAAESPVTIRVMQISAAKMDVMRR
jgi:hypothetical protein